MKREILFNVSSRYEAWQAMKKLFPKLNRDISLGYLTIWDGDNSLKEELCFYVLLSKTELPIKRRLTLKYKSDDLIMFVRVKAVPNLWLNSPRILPLETVIDDKTVNNGENFQLWGNLYEYLRGSIILKKLKL